MASDTSLSLPPRYHNSVFTQDHNHVSPLILMKNHVSSPGNLTSSFKNNASPSDKKLISSSFNQMSTSLHSTSSLLPQTEVTCNKSRSFSTDNLLGRPSSNNDFFPVRPSSSNSSNTSGLAVTEGVGGTVKVATDRPHLVSMGSGRLSTAVTLHPINEGKTIMGAGGMGVIPDIVVLGTGVDPEHCILNNDSGVVTLTPIAPMTVIDGLRITAPTRLTQGKAQTY